MTKFMKTILVSCLFVVSISFSAVAAGKNDSQYNIVENGKFEEILSIIGDKMKDEYADMFKQAGKAQDIISRYISEQLKYVIDAFNGRKG